MSDFSLTLVLQFKTSKIINDMAKVQIKSEKITPFGGIFHVRELFSRYVDPVIDKVLGIRCTSFGYQYSEIIRAVFSVFCCGGDCMEDLNLYLKDVLTERPHTRVPSADTVLRGIEELATENISYHNGDSPYCVQPNPLSLTHNHPHHRLAGKGKAGHPHN